MLAVFKKSVASAPSDLANMDPASRCRGFDLLQSFKENYRTCVSMQCGGECTLAYSLDVKQETASVADLFSKVQFAANGEIFCIFLGHLENLHQLSHIYGIKSGTEAQLAIRAYHLLAEQGIKSVDRLVQDFHGEFSVCIYDNKHKEVLIAKDNMQGRPLFWGTCEAGHLIVSDSAELLKGECGKSFAPFPSGCYFTSAFGLHSFTHPNRQLKAVPRVDSKGEVCGATFRVASEQDLARKGVQAAASFLGSF